MLAESNENNSPPPPLINQTVIMISSCSGDLKGVSPIPPFNLVLLLNPRYTRPLLVLCIAKQTKDSNLNNIILFNMTHKIIMIIRLIAVNRVLNRHEALKNIFAAVKRITVCFRMKFLTNIPVFSIIS